MGVGTIFWLGGRWDSNQFFTLVISNKLNNWGWSGGDNVVCNESWGGRDPSVPPVPTAMATRQRLAKLFYIRLLSFCGGACWQREYQLVLILALTSQVWRAVRGCTIQVRHPCKSAFALISSKSIFESLRLVPQDQSIANIKDNASQCHFWIYIAQSTSAGDWTQILPGASQSS